MMGHDATLERLGGQKNRRWEKSKEARRKRRAHQVRGLEKEGSGRKASSAE